MSNKQKGFLQGWGALEIGLLAVIVLLCVGAMTLGAIAFMGLGGGGDQTGPPGNGDVAVQADTPTPPADTEPEPLPGPDQEDEQDDEFDAAITLSPNAGTPGSTVTIQGQGFPANNRVVIFLVPGNPPNFALNSAVADENGSFSVDIIVPSDPRWLAESPVPVLAEAPDSGVKAQALLNIVTPDDAEPQSTPVSGGIIIVGGIQTTPQPPPPPAVAQLTATANVNIRQGPGTNYPVLGVLLAGQQGEITGRNNDATWWQIKFSGAATGRGWLSAAYASAQNIANVPVVNAPAPPPPPPPTPTPNPGVTITDWRGEYWNNKDLSGPPTLVRNDVAVNFDWGLGSPDPSIPVDFFSARWTRRLFFPAGTYRFFTRVDDGVRLYVNGALLINQWQIQSPTTYAADIYLPEGEHNLRMEYFEEVLGAVAILSWQRVDSYPAWRAEYYNNTSLSGPPVLVRNEPSINYNWGNGSPSAGLVNPEFSARWSRSVYFDNANYTFRIRSDDGVRIWIDNELIFDRWRDGDTGWLETNRTVPAGLRQLRVEHYKKGTGFINVGWTRSDRPPVPPLAVIKAPSEAEEGQSVTFDGRRSRSGDYRIVRWEWDFGDGKTARGDKVSHTFNDVGEYRVRLTVIDEIGQRDRTDTRIDIKENLEQNTPPVAVINAPTTGKVGQSLRFDGSQSRSISPIARYQWDFGDGIRASGAVQDHVYNRAGTYDVSLTVVAENGLRNTQSVNVRIDDAISGAEFPTAKINAPGNGQVGQALQFDATGSLPGINSTLIHWRWDFGDGAVADAQRVLHTYENPGEYNISLEVENNKGLKHKAQQIVTIVEAPPPESTPQPSISAPAEALVGEQVNFGASVVSAQPIVEYNWDFGDGQTATGEQTSHSYNAAGAYQVTLEVVDDAEASGTTQHDITVKELPPPPQPAIDGPDEAITGETVTFKARDDRDPNNTTPIVEYIWNFGEPAAQAQRDAAPQVIVNHTFTTPGVYNVELTLVDDLGRSETTSKEVTVTEPQQPGPEIPPTANIIGPDSATMGQPVTFDASNSAQGSSTVSSIEWDFGDGNSASGNIVVEHTYTAPGSYTVQLVLTDEAGQTGSDTKEIQIQDVTEPTPTPTPDVGNPPVAVFNMMPQTAEVNQPIDFDGGFSFGDNPLVQWDWDFGDGSSGQGMGATHAYASPGRYPVVLTVTDDQGLTNSSAPLFVEVTEPAAQPLPLPGPIEQTPTPTPAQPPTAEPPTAEPPTSEPPTPEPPTSEPPTAEPPAPEPAPTEPPPPEPQPQPSNPPVAGFAYDPSAPMAGAPVMFDGGFSYGDAAIVEWRWEFGDGTPPGSGMGVQHIYTTPGVYSTTLVVVDENGLTSSPSTQQVTVGPPAAPQPAPMPAPAPAPTDEPPAQNGDGSN